MDQSNHVVIPLVQLLLEKRQLKVGLGQTNKNSTEDNVQMFTNNTPCPIYWIKELKIEKVCFNGLK